MGLASDEAFNIVRARMAAVDAKDRKVQAVLKFHITQGGAVVKTMMLDLVNSKLYEGDDAAECTVKIDDQVLADILAMKTDPKEALQKGLCEVEGNKELLTVLKEQIALLK